MRAELLRAIALLALLTIGRQDGGADERLAVAALINGESVQLALDTGAEVSLLFRKAATRLRLNTVTEARRVPALNRAVHCFCKGRRV